MTKSIYCMVKIKQDNLPWNWNQSNPALRKQKQEENQKKFEQGFYTLVNKVVSLGGTVCLDRGALDNEWRMLNSQIRIKIDQENIDTIRSLPCIEAVQQDYRS